LRFGNLLRRWRDRYGVTQLMLAERAGVSSRHLSFLETGKAQPSREMVERLAAVLQVPLHDQNAWLAAAGFAPLYGQRELGSPDLEHAQRALEFILQQQEPYPAIVVDGAWNVRMRNAAVYRILSRFQRAIVGDVNDNAMRTIFHPDGLRPYVENWEELAYSLIQSIHAEEASGAYPAAAELRRELLAYPGVPEQWHTPDPLAIVPPLLTMKLRSGDLALSRFSRRSRRSQSRATSRCSNCASSVYIRRTMPRSRSPRAFERRLRALAVRESAAEGVRIRPQLAQRAGHDLRSFLGMEQLRSLELDDSPRAGDRFLEPVRPLDGEKRVRSAPEHLRGHLQLAKQRLDLDCLTWVLAALEPPLEQRDRLRRRRQRPEVFTDRVRRERVWTFVRDREAGACEREVREHGAQHSRQLAFRDGDAHGRKRGGRPVRVHIAVGERQAADAMRMPGGEDLRDASAAVVGDQVDSIDIQARAQRLEHLRLSRE
jgi:transcriptional regulator with XRE-family HTH domain